jgi:hypothetical protein
MNRAFAASAFVLLVLGLAACTLPPVAAPTTAIHSRMTPEAAAQLIRERVTGARPLLIPNTLAADWTAEVTPMSSGPTTTQFHPGYHGDADSLYQIADTTGPRSDRILVWREKGTWAVSGRAEVPYVLSSSGLTHEEFWGIANGLHPNQI